ncbi:hypothetical protein [Vibrio agarivorans]|uniref:Uncharacterized protein n=1 Tax=Vibrio agarivorans TaxID=153622 RepID=A0ABT7Y7M0_9VIBR|nr:hypothetical protein [Vibrio agarivorans]MDN2484005.1 hypothetical protein [Vibrio agarivorans]
MGKIEAMIDSKDIQFLIGSFLASGASLGLSIGIIVMMNLIGHNTVTWVSLIGLVLSGLFAMSLGVYKFVKIHSILEGEDKLNIPRQNH